MLNSTPGARDSHVSQPNNILSHPGTMATRNPSARTHPDHAGGRESSRSHAAEIHPKAAFAEKMVRLAEFLPPHERELVRTLYVDGHTVVEVAALLSTPVETMRRRVRRIAARMARPEFTFVALRRDAWTGPLRTVGVACVLEGKSLRCAARQFNLSIHVVRTMRSRVLAMAKGAQETTALLRRESPSIDRTWRS